MKGAGFESSSVETADAGVLGGRGCEDVGGPWSIFAAFAAEGAIPERIEYFCGGYRRVGENL
jgi:hypothetical protein